MSRDIVQLKKKTYSLIQINGNLPSQPAINKELIIKLICITVHRYFENVQCSHTKLIAYYTKPFANAM